MDTEFRGNSAEYFVSHSLLEKGYVVSEPQVDCKYDLVVDIDGKLKKVQVKRGYADGSRENTLRVNMYDQNDGNEKNDKYDEDEVDVFAIFDPINRHVYWIPFSEAPKTEIRRKFSSLEKYRLHRNL